MAAYRNIFLAVLMTSVVWVQAGEPVSGTRLSGVLSGAAYELSAQGLKFPATELLSLSWIGADAEAAVYELDANGMYVALEGTRHQAAVVYEHIYPNIDLIVFPPASVQGARTVVRYEFVVYPGGNPAHIKAQAAELTGLRVTTAFQVQGEGVISQITARLTPNQGTVQVQASAYEMATPLVVRMEQELGQLDQTAAGVNVSAR
jgi:hypothetical protein